MASVNGRPTVALVGASVVVVVASCLWQAYVSKRQREQKASQRWRGWNTTPYKCHPLASAKSAELAAAATVRPTDVVVVTFCKTGTTVLQQMCEVLRSGGDMNFSEITERQPWFDFAYDVGQDLDAEHAWQPRLFKSHQRLSAVNPGGKYVSIVRDPGSTAQSLFAFWFAKGRPVATECADVNDFISRGRFDDVLGTNIWDYYVELWEARHESNVLVFSYETLTKQKAKLVPILAAFLGVPCDAKVTDTVIRMSSKEFMLEHVGKFDDNFINRRTLALGRSKQAMATRPKVISAHASPGLTAEVTELLQQRWRERVTPRTGHQNYQAMADELAAFMLSR